MNHLSRTRRAGRTLGCMLAAVWALAPPHALAVAVRIDSFAPPRKSTTGVSARARTLAMGKIPWVPAAQRLAV
jgi:hypothetical protein